MGIADGDASGVTGRTTTEMQRVGPLTTMSAFDFAGTWTLVDGYPALGWEGESPLTVESVSADNSTAVAGEDGIVTVNATASDGGAASNVAIELVGAEGLDITDGDTAVTDENGTATFAFNETAGGLYDVDVAWAADGAVNDTATVTVVPYALDALSAADATVSAGNAGELVVSLVGQDGGPVAGENVTVIGADGLGGIDAGDVNETDENGEARFAFSDQTAGEYTLTVALQSWDVVTDAATVTVEPLAPATLDPIDATASAGENGFVSMTVRDTFGNPVPGTEINVTDAGGIDGLTNGSRKFTTLSGQVSFAFNETNADAYDLAFGVVDDESITGSATVTVTPADADPANSFVQPESGTTTVSDAFGDGNEITYDVSFADAYGNPLAKVDVQFAPRDGPESDAGSIETKGSATNTTDETGATSFTVRSRTAQTATLAFTEQKSDRQLTATATFEPGEATGIDASDVTATAGQQSQVVVVATDAFGNGVPGVAVNVTADGTLTGVEANTTLTTAETGAASVSFTETAVGTYDLSFALADDETETADATVTVEPGPPSAASNVVVSPADGVASVSTDFTASLGLTATFVDAFGNPITNENVVLSGGTDIASQDGDFEEQTDENGVATFTIRSETIQEDVTFTVTTTAVSPGFQETAQGTFEPGPAASLSVGDVSKYAGTPGELVVDVRDEFGHKVPGETISVVDDGGLTDIQSATTNESGTAVIAFAERIPGDYNVKLAAEDATVNDTATVAVDVTFEGGDGSAGNPYQIVTWDQLQGIEGNLDAHYQLADDLSPTSTNYTTFVDDPAEGFLPVGMSAPFTGSLDGDDHAVSGLAIDRQYASSAVDAALFTEIDNATIENLGLVDAAITAGDGEEAGDAAGDAAGLVVRNDNGTLRDVSVTDSRIAAGSGGDGQDGNDQMEIGVKPTGGEPGITGGTAAGLVVTNDGGVVRSAFVTTTKVFAGTGGDGGNGGKVCGVSECATRGADGGDGGDGGDTAGLASRNVDGEISDSYTNDVRLTPGSPGTGGAGGSGDRDDNDGSSGDTGSTGTTSGFAIRNDDTISSVYVTGLSSSVEATGAILVENTGTITDAYWDTETTGLDAAIGDDTGTQTRVTGLETREMRGVAETTMSNFDFDATWDVVFEADDGRAVSYPFLRDNPPVRQPGLETLYADGSGTDADPYLIEDWRHLDNVRSISGSAFAQNASLDASSDHYTAVVADQTSGFEPLGDPIDRFDGSFDGREHTIADLTIDRSGTDYVGLFGVVGPSGSVTNVGLDDADVTGDRWVGPLAGDNLGEITRSYATGSVSGDSQVGGLVGENRGAVRESYATTSVDGTNYVGGLAGENRGVVRESYAAGAVTGPAENESVAGLVGRNTATVADAYWDAEESSQDEGVRSGDDAGATGLTTLEMQRFAPMSTMPALDHGNAWTVTDGYPRLAWEGVERITVDSLDAEPATVTAGEVGAVNVTAFVGGVDAGEGVVVNVTENGSFPGLAVGDRLVTDANGEVEFAFSEAVTRTRTYELAFETTEGSPRATTTLTIVPAAVDSVTIGPTDAQAIEAGESIEFDAVAADEYGNVVEDDAGAFVWSNATDAGLFDNTTTGTYAVTAAYDGIGSDTTSVDVAPARPASIVVETQPADTVAGQNVSGPFELTVVDEFDNPVPNTDVNVRTNGSRADAVTATVETDATGRAAFSDLVVESAGTYELLVAVESVRGTVATDAFSVRPARASEISVAVEPEDGQVGDVLSGPPTALVTDAYGNAVGRHTVTISVEDTAFENGTATVTTGSTGQAVFDDLVVSDPGVYRLSFDAHGVSENATSDEFTIGAASPAPSPDPTPTPDPSPSPSPAPSPGPAPSPSPTPTPAPEPRPSVTIENADGQGTTDRAVRIQNPDPADPIVLESPAADGDSSADGDDASGPLSGVGGVRLDRMTMYVNTDEDFSLNVTTYGADLTPSHARIGETSEEVSTAAAGFERESGTLSVGYVHVDHALETGHVRNATFEFSISDAALDELGLTPADVTLFREDGRGNWNERETDHVGTVESVHQFEAEVPGFSVFAFGTNAPTIRVTDAALGEARLMETGTAAIEATVENRGQFRGERTLRLHANGAPVAVETVTLDAGASETVAFTYEPDGGQHAFTVDGVAVAPGTLTVTESAAAEETGATGDGSTAGGADEPPAGGDEDRLPWGASLLSALVLSVVGYLAHRRRG